MDDYLVVAEQEHGLMLVGFVHSDRRPLNTVVPV